MGKENCGGCELGCEIVKWGKAREVKRLGSCLDDVVLGGPEYCSVFQRMDALRRLLEEPVFI
jgi:hypothetical protein